MQQTNSLKEGSSVSRLHLKSSINFTFEQLRSVATCQGLCRLVNCNLLCEVSSELADVVLAIHLRHHRSFVDLLFELLPVDQAEECVVLEVFCILFEAESIAWDLLEKFGNKVTSVFANLK